MAAAGAGAGPTGLQRLRASGGHPAGASRLPDRRPAPAIPLGRGRRPPRPVAHGRCGPCAGPDRRGDRGGGADRDLGRLRRRRDDGDRRLGHRPAPAAPIRSATFPRASPRATASRRVGPARPGGARHTLVVTCDCGVSNAARSTSPEIGMDVVITDHHLPPPCCRAAAVVDPHRPDCAYPDPDLTGAGLSYKLAAALLARHGGATAWRRWRRSARSPTWRP